MIVTLNQIAYFKPQTTARRLKTYYYSGDFQPVVFLNYLRLINLTAILCPQVAQLSVTLYRQEVRALFFAHREERAVLLQLWRFRRFFTPGECCELLQGVVLANELKDENQGNTIPRSVLRKSEGGGPFRAVGLFLTKQLKRHRGLFREPWKSVWDYGKLLVATRGSGQINYKKVTSVINVGFL
ncbi:hypothetical protein [Enterococcus asini]|uniref:hypothetical protein n=1 Tax=Enterococcus asini TaxID=57732 RepID=UPI000E4ECBAA|nr:hypothetical protein [Enterococcus asini]RGW15170.1 hypothetical protein DWV91_00865 [Enterococcus asini]